MSRSDTESKIIAESGLFDRDWYLDQYPDVRALGVDPIKHYLRLGALLQRNPGPGFDAVHYTRMYPDVAKAGINPLVHYATEGRKEGRLPLPQRITVASTGDHIDIIIPVYNALEDVMRCLEAVVVKTDGFQVRPIIVNDGSDSSTSAWLNAFCKKHSSITLIEHAENRGYTAAINAGLRASTASYVVTLNSDTIVTSGWLSGLVRCINSRSDVGVAGPLSNAASWQSVPQLFGSDGNFLVNDLNGVAPDSMAALVRKYAKPVYPEFPFINGFCFMITRAVIDRIGVMDEVTFPEGYGEENDYCIRAAEAGFRLVVADDTYVYHAKSKSFGHEKRGHLSKEGATKLVEKHGHEKYHRLVRLTRNNDALENIRTALQNALEQSHTESNEEIDILSMKVLFLLPVSGGGGGSHSVIQEAVAMRRLGVHVRIAVKRADLESFVRAYAEIGDARGLFEAFDSRDIVEVAQSYDVVVATVNTSVALLRDVIEAHPHILPAYYIQDYEPLFYSPESEPWRQARSSYALISGCLLFAKTHWIARKVRAEHGVAVSKVTPSIDHEVYFPRPRKTASTIRIAAMIRPQTPYRGAERTMRVLARLAARLGSVLQIHVFGCDDDDARLQSLNRAFPFFNHGILSRTQVAALLADSDIFIDLSDYQAFGRTGLEALACGCVAVVPVHGGADEYAVDGLNALVVDTADEDACYDRILELAQDKRRLRSMKMEGLRTASAFSGHSAAMSELTLFATTLAKHRVRCPKPKKPRLCLVPALSPNSEGGLTPTGSAYVRLLYPYHQPEVLRRWEVSTCSDGHLPDVSGAGVCIVQRDVDLPGAAISKWVSALHEAGGRLVYEIDDDLLDADALRCRGYRGDIAKLAERVKLFLRLADVVTVSTEYLGRRLREYNENIAIVPNYLDKALWSLDKPREHASGAFARRKDVVRIGYVGTQTHDGDLSIIKDAVEYISQKYRTSVEVEVIGAFQNRIPLFGQRVGLPKNSIYPNFVEWLQKRVHWDIAVIPLEDCEFNRSKSPLKFLECAALDTAIVCSKSTTYDEMARDGVNCLQVENITAAWIAALENLVSDAELRQRLARNARQHVVEHYTTDVHSDLYLDLLGRTGREVPVMEDVV